MSHGRELSSKPCRDVIVDALKSTLLKPDNRAFVSALSLSFSLVPMSCHATTRHPNGRVRRKVGADSGGRRAMLRANVISTFIRIRAQRQSSIDHSGIPRPAGELASPPSPRAFIYPSRGFTYATPRAISLLLSGFVARFRSFAEEGRALPVSRSPPVLCASPCSVSSSSRIFARDHDTIGSLARLPSKSRMERVQ